MEEIFKMNDKHEYFNPYLSQCGECIFFDWSNSWTCKAFPKGIPDNILKGDQKHNKPVQGQEGSTIFTPES